MHMYVCVACFQRETLRWRVKRVAKGTGELEMGGEGQMVRATWQRQIGMSCTNKFMRWFSNHDRR